MTIYCNKNGKNMGSTRLGQALSAIGEPPSYYAGTTPSALSLPDNVILFHRTRSDSLGQGRASHHRFVLILNNATSGSVIIDTHSFRLVPGQAILIFPHQFHHYLDIESAGVSWLFVTFEHRQPEQLQALRNIPVEYSDISREHASMLVEKWSLEPSVSHRDTGIAFLCGLLLNELLAAVPGVPSLPAKPSLNNPHIDAVHGFIRRHLSEPFTTRQIARAIGLSESRLRAVYHQCTGLTLGRYISELRLNRASGLLVRSQMSVKEIARDCGYESLFSFSRAFKREFGVSPRAYRESGRVR